VKRTRTSSRTSRSVRITPLTADKTTSKLPTAPGQLITPRRTEYKNKSISASIGLVTATVEHANLVAMPLIGTSSIPQSSSLASIRTPVPSLTWTRSKPNSTQESKIVWISHGPAGNKAKRLNTTLSDRTSIICLCRPTKTPRSRRSVTM